MCSLGKPTIIRWEVDTTVEGTHNMHAIKCNGKCVALQEGSENMNIGVSHYCENPECKVEIYSVTVDDVIAGEKNCPGCGQFGRTKG